jgi:hypothetical protein
MSISAPYFVGMISGILLILGLNFIQRRQQTMGFGIWVGVFLLTLLGGYMSFSF